jgi:hypothetical protein
MTNKALTMGVMAAVLVIGGIAQATPIYVATTGADFATLLGGAATSIGSPVVSNYSGGDLSATVTSQAFTDGAGNYLYLYQVKNVGPLDSDIVTRFTASPFADADSQISLGYLTANIPASFLLGDQTPFYADVNVGASPTVGFNFPVGIPFVIPDSFIAPGKSSKVLYVESSLAPGLVTGNIIDGQVYSGLVVGPVPEPGTLVLLVTAGLGVLAYVWRKRAA